MAKQNGAVIVAVNPLPEAGLINFHNPQTPKGVVGGGTDMADDFLQIRLGGDQALLMAVAQILLQDESVVDRAFIDEYTAGFDEYAAHVKGLDLAELVAATGLTEPEVRGLAARFAASSKTIVCWAMGITQHKHSVATIREIVNVLLIQGNLGRPGAGVCPVRGHSNVQGDRTMGIFEKMPEWFMDNLQQEFGFDPPREHGFDTVNSIRAMRDGKIDVFMAVGGNFIRATPDSEVTEAALRRCRLTVQVSTKLNRSHTVCGDTALILPTLGRTDRDFQASGEQRVSVEDSMSRVHASRGNLKPPSENLLSEVSILTRLARRAVGDKVDVPWEEFEADYRTIRSSISAWCRASTSTRASWRTRTASPCRTPHAAGGSPPTAAAPTSPRSRWNTPGSPKDACCCRPCAATTSTTPPSTAWTTATAASRTAVAWSS